MPSAYGQDIIYRLMEMQSHIDDIKDILHKFIVTPSPKGQIDIFVPRDIAKFINDHTEDELREIMCIKKNLKSSKKC